MAEEKVYFKDPKDRAVVTSARFIVPDGTFAVAGITSVKHASSGPPKMLAVLCMIVGLLGMFLAKDGQAGIPLVILLLGVVLAAWPGRYSVMLSSASGESRALTSRDKAFITGVIAALNDAIVERSSVRP